MRVNRASTQLIRTVGALLLGVAVAGAPALTYAQGHTGGGGGGHSGGGGGGHSGGGGGGHSGGGGGHAMGGGGHFSGGHISGGHFAAATGAHFAAGAGGHYYAGPHFAGAAGGQTYHVAAHGRFAGTSAMHAPTRCSGAGGFVPGWNGSHAWGGGYWRGGFWPRCYFNPGFAWFLPILPFGYATFWWGGMPYYYWNNLYYSWSPGDNGYVVTDPPPVAGSDATDSSSDGTYSGTYNGAAPSGGGGGSGVYLYPRNGQSDEQTQKDRYECHSWAVNQTGFDPTRSSQQSSGSVPAYSRAMGA